MPTPKKNERVIHATIPIDTHTQLQDTVYLLRKMGQRSPTMKSVIVKAIEQYAHQVSANWEELQALKEETET